MEYTRFGNSGLKVSRLCWGGMSFYDRTDEAGSVRMVHDAIEAGINFFDTADGYGGGKSEVMLGKALQGRRDHVVIATKLWVPMYPEDPNGRGCGRYHMMRAVEDSLRRLGTDHIDLYQLHHPDTDAPVEETLATLDALVKQGKVRYIGVSNHYAWQMAHMLGVSALHNWEPLISLQCQYSILNRSVENETANFCRRFNMAVMTYSPLSFGILSGKYKRGENPPAGSRLAGLGLNRCMVWAPGQTQEQVEDRLYDTLEELERIAAQYNLGLNQLAVKWLMTRDWVTCPIIGGALPEHFDPMYGLCEVTIDEADLARIDDLSAHYRYVPFKNQAVAAGACDQKNWW